MCAEYANGGEGDSSWRGRGLVLPGSVVWQMLEQLQSGQEGKGYTLEAARTEAQDARREHNVHRSGDVGVCGSGRDLSQRPGIGDQSSAVIDFF